MNLCLDWKLHAYIQFSALVFQAYLTGRNGEGEKPKIENLNQRSSYDSMKEQPLLLSISRDPSSAQKLISANAQFCLNK